MYELQRTRVLVTGGAGFLGSHLCERLLEQGKDVICLDNYFTGTKDNIIKLMDTPDEVTGPFNMGNPGEFTIKELAEKVIEMTGSSSKLVFKPLPSDDPTQRCPDISRAKKQFNWVPEIELEQGLKPTINYFDKFLKSRGKL